MFKLIILDVECVSPPIHLIYSPGKTEILWLGKSFHFVGAPHPHG